MSDPNETIAEAAVRHRLVGPSVDRIRQFVLLRDSKAALGVLDNIEYHRALQYTSLMLACTTKTVDIVGGLDLLQFLDHLVPEMRQVVTRLMLNNGRLRILLLDHPEHTDAIEAGCLRLRQQYSGPWCSVRYGTWRDQASRIAPLQTTIICDETMVREERTRFTPVTLNSPARGSVVAALSLHGDDKVVQRVQQHFDLYWGILANSEPQMITVDFKAAEGNV
jgi:hypothetical protein